jgi:hypothetical protein
MEAANKAKTWTIVSAVVGAVFLVIVIAIAAGTAGSPDFGPYT